MITGPQTRAGRQLLRWQKQKLAKTAGLRVQTIERAERAQGEPELTIAHLSAIRRALETAGVNVSTLKAVCPEKG